MLDTPSPPRPILLHYWGMRSSPPLDLVFSWRGQRWCHKSMVGRLSSVCARRPLRNEACCVVHFLYRQLLYVRVYLEMLKVCGLNQHNEGGGGGGQGEKGYKAHLLGSSWCVFCAKIGRRTTAICVGKSISNTAARRFVLPKSGATRLVSLSPSITHPVFMCSLRSSRTNRRWRTPEQGRKRR